MLATTLPLFSGRLQLPISLGVDLLLTPRQHALWCDVADGAVQADVVVVAHVAFYQTPRIIEGQRRSGPDALLFERERQSNTTLDGGRGL